MQRRSSEVKVVSLFSLTASNKDSAVICATRESSFLQSLHRAEFLQKLRFLPFFFLPPTASGFSRSGDARGFPRSPTGREERGQTKTLASSTSVMNEDTESSEADGIRVKFDRLFIVMTFNTLLSVVFHWIDPSIAVS